MLYIVVIILCVVLVFSPVWAAQNQPSLMLAKTGHIHALPDKPNAYVVSEKLDGIRAIWTGKTLLTRQGNVIHAPDWFTEPLPNQMLEGELWLARNTFSQLYSITSKHTPSSEEWQNVKFMLFDLPTSEQPFSKRVTTLERITAELNLSHVDVIKHHSFEHFHELEDYYNHVIKDGGEGLMLNLANANYETGRNSALLKIKPYYDDEATVVGHQTGKGKFENMLGALIVKNSKGQKFKIGTGFTTHERQNPPQKGETDTYKYFGLTNTGLPRFASFLRVNKEP